MERQPLVSGPARRGCTERPTCNHIYSDTDAHAYPPFTDINAYGDAASDGNPYKLTFADARATHKHTYSDSDIYADIASANQYADSNTDTYAFASL